MNNWRDHIDWTLVALCIVSSVMCLFYVGEEEVSSMIWLLPIFFALFTAAEAVRRRVAESENRAAEAERKLAVERYVKETAAELGPDAFVEIDEDGNEKPLSSCNSDR